MNKISANIALVVIIAATLTGCSNTVQQTPIINKAPSAPAGLEGKANSQSSVTLTWQDTSDNELGFRVYRNDVVVSSLGTNTTTFTDNGLKYGTTYSYRASAFNDAGETGGATNVQVKTINPAIALRIDTIGVIKDHDPWPKGPGDIYAYVAVGDGNGSPQVIRIPASQTMVLNDNESKNMSQQVFSASAVGDKLKFVVLAFESDNPVAGGAGKLLVEGLNLYLTFQYGRAGELVGTLIKSQVSESDDGAPMELAESPSDDFVGAIDKTFSVADNWGIGSYRDVTSGDLRVSFTISLATTP